MEIHDAECESYCMHCRTEWRYLALYNYDHFRIPCGHGGSKNGQATMLPPELLALAVLLLEDK